MQRVFSLSSKVYVYVFVWACMCYALGSKIALTSSMEYRLAVEQRSKNRKGGESWAAERRLWWREAIAAVVVVVAAVDGGGGGGRGDRIGRNEYTGTTISSPPSLTHPSLHHHYPAPPLFPLPLPFIIRFKSPSSILSHVCPTRSLGPPDTRHHSLRDKQRRRCDWMMITWSAQANKVCRVGATPSHVGEEKGRKGRMDGEPNIKPKTDPLASWGKDVGRQSYASKAKKSLWHDSQRVAEPRGFEKLHDLLKS